MHSYSKLFIKILSMSVNLPDGRKWVGWIICCVQPEENEYKTSSNGNI